MCHAIGFASSASQDDLTQIKRNRSCTDVLCLLAFLGFLGGSVFLFVWADEQGANPDLLIRPVDHRGRICGLDEGVKDKPIGIWPDLSSFTFMECSTDCDATWVNANGSVPFFAGMTRKDPLDNSKYVGYESGLFFNYYCIPTGTESLSISDLDGGSEQMRRHVRDVQIAWPAILGGGIAAIILALAYVAVCRKMARFLVWGTLIGIALGGGVALYVIYGKADVISTESAGNTASDSRDSTLRAAFWSILVGMVLYLSIVLFLRTRIQMAIEVASETSRALTDMPLLILFPAVPFALAGLYIIYWIGWGLYLFAIKKKEVVGIPDEAFDSHPYWQTELDTNPTTGDLVYTKMTRVENSGAWVYYAFSIFWHLQFLVYWSYAVIAGAVAQWYFTRESADGQKRVQGSPVAESAARTTRYHLGSIAFGSLILAVIRFLRFFLEGIRTRVQSRNNAVQRCVWACMRCCIICLECCLEKIGENAFIWQAIYGDPFCPSAISAFKLLWANLARVAAITLVGDALVGIGKVMVASMSTGLLAVFLLNVEPYKSELNSVLMPLIFVFVVSWVIAALFLEVYETGVETIFLCFLRDQELFNDPAAAHDKPFASQGLIDVVDRYHERSERRAAKLKGGGDVVG